MSECLCCDVVYEHIENGIGCLSSKTYKYSHRGDFTSNGRRTGIGTSSFLDGRYLVEGVFKNGEIRPGCGAVKLVVTGGRPEASTTFIFDNNDTLQNFLPKTLCPTRIQTAHLEFEGTLAKNGSREGKGVIKNLRTDQVILVSNSWHNDYPSRLDRLVTPIGVFSGDLGPNCQIDGYGVLISDILTYEGHWQNSKPHGFGNLMWKSGSKSHSYRGYFEQGKRSGYGEYNERAVEYWQNDQLTAGGGGGGGSIPSTPSFNPVQQTLDLAIMPNPFKPGSCSMSMKALAENIALVTTAIRAHEAHYDHYVTREESESNMQTAVTSPIFKECCTELKLISVEGLNDSTQGNEQYQLTLCLGDNGGTVIQSSWKELTSKSGVLWKETFELPSAFESCEKIYVQLFCKSATTDDKRVIGGGFITLTSGLIGCMLIGRDSSGFRGPVGLARFQGNKIIDLKQVEPEICFTL